MYRLSCATLVSWIGLESLLKTPSRCRQGAPKEPQSGPKTPPREPLYCNLRGIWLGAAVLYRNLQGLVALAGLKNTPWQEVCPEMSSWRCLHRDVCPEMFARTPSGRRAAAHIRFGRHLYRERFGHLGHDNARRRSRLRLRAAVRIRLGRHLYKEGHLPGRRLP